MPPSRGNCRAGLPVLADLPPGRPGEQKRPGEPMNAVEPRPTHVAGPIPATDLDPPAGCRASHCSCWMSKNKRSLACGLWINSDGAGACHEVTCRVREFTA